MRRIGGTLRTPSFGLGGGDGEIPLFAGPGSNLTGRWETVPGGEFDWGGRLLKSNGGAQRFPQGGWKSPVACIGRKGA